MQWLQNNILYVWIGSIGIYAIISSYFLSKIFVKFGKSEIFWFVITNALYPFILCYFLLRTNFKEKFTQKEKKIVTLSLFVFIFLILLIPILISINVLVTSYTHSNIATGAKFTKTNISGISLPDWIIFPLIILIPFYCVFAAYCVSIIMNKLDSKRAWFYSVLFFHVIILLYIMANQHYRTKLNLSEKMKIISFGIGYFVFAFIAFKILDV